eukprot:8646684-Heterocapsa_arctica.AAC.1
MPGSDSQTQPHKSWPGGRADGQRLASGSSRLRTLWFLSDHEQHGADRHGGGCSGRPVSSTSTG